MPLGKGTDWGSVPAWVSGIGTTLAVTISLALGLYNLRNQQRQKRDDEEGQARTVVVGGPVPLAPSSGQEISYCVTLMNFSDAPIHDVVIGFHAKSGDDPEWKHTYRMLDYIEPKGRSQQEYAGLLAKPSGGAAPTAFAQAEFKPVELWFLDAAGRRWFRTNRTYEAARILDYVPPQLAKDEQERIRAARRRDRQRLWKRRAA
jgi:hypothetical protein